eukprot:gene35190-45577_t
MATIENTDDSLLGFIEGNEHENDDEELGTELEDNDYDDNDNDNDNDGPGSTTLRINAALFKKRPTLSIEKQRPAKKSRVSTKLPSNKKTIFTDQQELEFLTFIKRLKAHVRETRTRTLDNRQKGVEQAKARFNFIKHDNKWDKIGEAMKRSPLFKNFSADDSSSAFAVDNLKARYRRMKRNYVENRGAVVEEHKNTSGLPELTAVESALFELMIEELNFNQETVDKNIKQASMTKSMTVHELTVLTNSKCMKPTMLDKYDAVPLANEDFFYKDVNLSDDSPSISDVTSSSVDGNVSTTQTTTEVKKERKRVYSDPTFEAMALAIENMKPNHNLIDLTIREREQEMELARKKDEREEKAREHQLELDRKRDERDEMTSNTL